MYAPIGGYTENASGRNGFRRIDIKAKVGQAPSPDICALVAKGLIAFVHPELLDRKKAEFFAKLSFLNITRDGIVEGERNLLDLALVMMNSTATDPRDQVYSMRGLLHPAHRDRVTVDYAIPAWQTYAAATYSTMVYEGNLEALKFVRICNDRMPELPSWAIDFRPFSFIMPRTRRNSDFDERNCHRSADLLSHHTHFNARVRDNSPNTSHLGDDWRVNIAKVMMATVLPRIWNHSEDAL